MRKVFFFVFIVFMWAQSHAQSIQEKIDELVAAYVAQHQFNGSVLLGQKGKILYSKGFGISDAEKNLSNSAGSIYQIGSLTKQVTAAVIMQLQEEKKLSVSDKLNKFFPQFPNSEKITIRHLLTHTSGLHDYGDDSTIVKTDVTRPFKKDELIKKFAAYRPDFEPGSNWNYSNAGYSVLGYIIEQIEGKPYEKVVRDRIFTPLGMSQSGFDFTNLKSPSKTIGYFSLHPNPASAFIIDSTLSFSAGAIYSTIEDFYKWASAISSGKLLKAESWNEVFTPFRNKYGYGWGIDSLFGREVMAHTGGIPGFMSFILRFPKDDLVVLVFDNTMSQKVGEIGRTIAAIALNQSYKIPQEKKEATVDVSTLKQYVGEYQFAPTFSITVSLDGNQLKAQATGQPQFEVFAEKENVFFYKVVEAKIEFVKDANGVVTEMILYQNGQEPRGKKIK